MRARLLRLWGAVPAVLFATTAIGCASVATAQRASGRAPAPSQVQSYAGREYLLHVPARLANTGASAPLLVVLHGGGANARHAESNLGMTAVGDSNGYVVVHASGTPGPGRLMRTMLTWNAGEGCCGPASRRNEDDVGYLAGLISHLASTMPIDTARVYLAGHSNGAMMAYRFACERPGVVAAIVPISGVLMAPSCKPTKVSVLHIHGADDANVPVGGGVGDRSVSRVPYRSVAESRASLERAGASFELKLVPGARHKPEEISAGLERMEGRRLVDVVARFLQGKTLR